MKGRNESEKGDPGLRERAEASLAERCPVPEEVIVLSRSDLEKLVHELRVRQLELERQNEELRSAQDLLTQSRDRYSDLYDFAPVGYFTVDRHGLILGVNLTGAALLAVDRSLMIGKPFRQFLAEEYANTFFLQKQEAFGSETRRRCEVKLRRSDGATFDARVEILAVDSPDGQRTQYRLIVSDITERKRSEEQQQTLHRRFHTVLSGLYAGVLLVTEDSQVEFANRSFCDQFNLESSSEELIGLSAAEMMEKIQNFYADPVSAIKRIQEILACGLPVKGEEITLRNGRTYLRDFIPLEIEGKRYGRFWQHQDITERKQAEEALRESQASLQLALRSARMGAWYLDLTEDRRYFDEQACQLLGIDAATFNGAAEEFFSVVHPEDHEKIKTALAQTIEQDVPFHSEFRVIQPDGSVHHISSRGRMARDDHRRPLRLTGIIWDVTERKRAEEERRQQEELAEREARLRELAENLHQILWLRTSDRILYINAAYETICGLKREDLYDNPNAILNSIHADDRERMRCALEVERAQGTLDEEFRIIRPEGARRWLHARAFPIWQNERVARIVGIAEDITAQKEANELLAREHAFRRAIIDQAWDGICVCHDIPAYPFVRFTVWNDAMTRITGYTLDQINRLGWYQTLYSDPHMQARVMDRMQRMRKGEDIVNEEWEITHADGSQRVLRISTTVLKFKDEDPHVLALMQDFTRRKQTEEALLAKEEELLKSREYYRILARKLITALEEERRWLGRELHDDLTQRVTALALATGVMLQHATSLPSPLAEQLRLFNQQTMNLAEDVHSLSRRLHPSVVEDFGIVEAIRLECLKFREARIFRSGSGIARSRTIWRSTRPCASIESCRKP